MLERLGEYSLATKRHSFKVGIICTTNWTTRNLGREKRYVEPVRFFHTFATLQHDAAPSMFSS